MASRDRSRSPCVEEGSMQMLLRMHDTIHALEKKVADLQKTVAEQHTIIMDKNETIVELKLQISESLQIPRLDSSTRFSCVG